MSNDTLEGIIAHLRMYGAQNADEATRIADRIQSLWGIRPVMVPPGWRLVPVEATSEMIDAVRAGTVEPQSMQAALRIIEAWKAKWRKLLAAAPNLPGLRRVRHRKRQSSYVVFGEGRLQTARPISDMEPLTFYQAEDGSLWARPPAEFEDGRFDDLPRHPVAHQKAVQSCPAIGFRCRRNGGRWQYIDDRSPDSYELRECEIESVFAGTPPVNQRGSLQLTGYQVKCLAEFVEQSAADVDITVGYFPAGADADSGGSTPEGLWVFHSGNPVAGRYYLPPDEESERGIHE